MPPSAAFLRFWQADLTRTCFVSHTTTEDRQALRLVCHDFAQDIAPALFSDININFETDTFTRHTRMNALGRIGQHFKRVKFSMPHTADTFLPPLLDPFTGEEQVFNYNPALDLARHSDPGLSISSDESWEMIDLLVMQYPPIFHAATNISSFVRAFSAMTNIKSLRISCPGQQAEQRYRRSAVDYALISLRMAVERTCPLTLDTLILSPIHASAPYYLRPFTSFGSSPRSSRIWRRIKSMTIEIDCHDSGSSASPDHFKLFHTYISAFSSLKTIEFTWLGKPGPMPLALHSEPCCLTTSSTPIIASICPSSRLSSTPPGPSLPGSYQPTKGSSSNCSTSPTSEPTRPQKQTLRPISLANLETLSLHNAHITSPSQIAEFITAHRRTLIDFSFTETHLLQGSWDDALSPLTKISGSEKWKQGHSISRSNSIRSTKSYERTRPRPQSYDRKRGSVKVDLTLAIPTQPASLPREDFILDDYLSTDDDEGMEVPIMLSATPSPTSIKQSASTLSRPTPSSRSSSTQQPPAVPPKDPSPHDLKNLLLFSLEFELEQKLKKQSSPEPTTPSPTKPTTTTPRPLPKQRPKQPPLHRNLSDHPPPALIPSSSLIQEETIEGPLWNSEDSAEVLLTAFESRRHHHSVSRIEAFGHVIGRKVRGMLGHRTNGSNCAWDAGFGQGHAMTDHIGCWDGGRGRFL